MTELDLLGRGDPAYEAARRATCWNARTPPRYPDAVVQAASEDDVVQALRLARAEGWKVGVRTGGHSWAGNHVRDGGQADARDPPRGGRRAGDRRDPPGARGQRREARAALALLETCPVAGRAKLALPYVPATLADLYDGVHAAYPDEHRYGVDNM